MSDTNLVRRALDKERDEEEEEVCVVCFREVEIYSVGECDHPVCYECSTRMRVLCARTECPICRKEMSKVVFTPTVVQYAVIKTRNMHYERRYAIFFDTDYVMKTYDTLLEHRCQMCDDQPTFRNFAQLKDHMRKTHERFYCELCVENLKIFTHERRSYTRSQLAQHRRKGDIDDRSHRGHPLCEFCDERFMDNDDLFRHLRRDHFFCHFCDADGMHQYYNDYNDLRKHFRADHYLCEEGACQEEKFTSAFRSKLDLQAHCTQTHAQGMSRQASRQARTVDIEFTVNHRQQQDGGMRNEERGGRGGRGSRGGRGGRGGRRDRDYEDTRTIEEIDDRPPPVTQQIDINCVQDFPSLNGPGPGSGTDGTGGSSKSMANHLAQQNRFTIRTRGGSRSMNTEEFPSLGSTSVTVSTAQATSHSPASPTTSVHLKVNTKKGGKEGQGQGGGQRSGNVSNVSIQYNRTMPSSNMDTSADNKENENKKGAQIGVISHSSNITLQSKANSKPKSKGLDEDFPALSISKSSNNSMSSGWGATVVPPPLSAPAKSHKNSKNDFPSLGPSMAPPPLRTSKNDFPSLGPSMGQPSVVPTKPGKKFHSSDFPTLATITPESQIHMKNYHGSSSVTIPVNNAWTNSVDQVPVASEPVDSSNGPKGKKKKKGGKPDISSSNNNNNVIGGTQNMSNGRTNKPASSKKKPRGLQNIFDDSDEENGIKTDLTMGKLGDYESLAPVVAASNMRMITSETINERKKSELKIGNLQKPPQKPPPVFDSEEAFPTLGNTSSLLTTSTWSSPAKKSGSSVPASGPPGFFSKPKAPPGFNTATDMTFTTSSGEKFAISPTTETAISPSNFTAQPTASYSSYTFLLPPNFELRNKNLIRTIHDECGEDEEKFECFKQLAGLLRSGELHGQAYYEQCRSVMGKATFHKILPELLVLLPDIKKQQEVLAAYRKVDGGRGCTTLFAVCVVCKQVLCQEDFNQHMESHSQVADFPSLSQVSSHMRK